MDVFGEPQPDSLPISAKLCLKKFSGIYPEALIWYQDRETLRLVDGPGRAPCTAEILEHMYHYLEQKGELYYIEYKFHQAFIPVGDVTLAPHDLPIVIGRSELRGRGIGYTVIQTLIGRALKLGLSELNVREIYDYNLASQKLFLKCGFERAEQTKLGYAYKRTLR
ncbi:MAG: GNAT family N-acetyltransferase [Sporolactobacillus sp.]